MKIDYANKNYLENQFFSKNESFRDYVGKVYRKAKESKLPAIILIGALATALLIGTCDEPKKDVIDIQNYEVGK